MVANPTHQLMILLFQFKNYIGWILNEFRWKFLFRTWLTHSLMFFLLVNWLAILDFSHFIFRKINHCHSMQILKPCSHINLKYTHSVWLEGCSSSSSSSSSSSIVYMQACMHVWSRRNKKLEAEEKKWKLML
jgi:hypothetical protein